MSKKTKQTKHFMWRLRQRYGIKINRKEIQDYVGLIQANRGIQVVHLETQSCRVSVKIMAIKGKVLPVVYDKKRKTLVTALPQAWLKRFMKKEQL
tara:strand:- start:954 stop:1238 length:285 start_codon:yes stop_codon:yes gene_type:complete